MTPIETIITVVVIVTIVEVIVIVVVVVVVVVTKQQPSDSLTDFSIPLNVIKNCSPQRVAF